VSTTFPAGKFWWKSAQWHLGLISVQFAWAGGGFRGFNPLPPDWIITQCLRRLNPLALAFLTSQTLIVIQSIFKEYISCPPVSRPSISCLVAGSVIITSGIRSQASSSSSSTVCISGDVVERWQAISRNDKGCRIIFYLSENFCPKMKKKLNHIYFEKIKGEILKKMSTHNLIRLKFLAVCRKFARKLQLAVPPRH